MKAEYSEIWNWFVYFYLFNLEQNALVNNSVAALLSYFMQFSYFDWFFICKIEIDLNLDWRIFRETFRKAKNKFDTIFHILKNQSWDAMEELYQPETNWSRQLKDLSR